jgi:CubicO group peptidase (beta-lactamase class C family)
LLVPIAVAVCLAAPVRAQSDSPLLRLFRDYIESLRVQTGIPGLALAVVGGSTVLWDEAFGRQDLERSIAARSDTPFHAAGLTQILTSTLVLRCVEDGSVSLDATVGAFAADAPEPNATIRQLLTHTSGSQENPIFQYRPERLDPLAAVVRACTADSFRESATTLFDRLAMRDSVPGPDAPTLAPPAEGIPDPEAAERFARVLERLARPYRVDAQKRAFPSTYAATTLRPSGGLVSTALDLAKFDLAMKDGVLLLPSTLAVAYTPPAGAGGQPLPHGLGWFAQTFNGEKIVWQFGVSENAGSALVVVVPARRMTYIILANSVGLVEPQPLTVSQLMASPFIRVLLGFFPGPG